MYERGVPDGDFVDKIRKIVAAVGVANAANAFSVSQPTIQRWSNYKNLPHQAMRKPIMEF